MSDRPPGSPSASCSYSDESYSCSGYSTPSPRRGPALLPHGSDAPAPQAHSLQGGSHSYARLPAIPTIRVGRVPAIRLPPFAPAPNSPPKDTLLTSRQKAVKQGARLPPGNLLFNRERLSGALPSLPLVHRASESESEPPVPLLGHAPPVPVEEDPGRVRSHLEQQFLGVCSQLAGFLFIASSAVAASANALHENAITHVVNLAPSVICPVAPGVHMRVYVPRDSADESLETLFYDAIAFIDAARRTGGRCLVACHKGVSRSAAVCIAYFMWAANCSLARAFAHVKAVRPIISPNMGFVFQLRAWDRKRRATPHGAAAARVTPLITGVRVPRVTAPKKLLRGIPREEDVDTHFRDGLQRHLAVPMRFVAPYSALDPGLLVCHAFALPAGAPPEFFRFLDPRLLWVVRTSELGIFVWEGSRAAATFGAGSVRVLQRAALTRIAQLQRFEQVPIWTLYLSQSSVEDACQFVHDTLGEPAPRAPAGLPFAAPPATRMNGPLSTRLRTSERALFVVDERPESSARSESSTRSPSPSPSASPSPENIGPPRAVAELCAQGLLNMSASVRVTHKQPPRRPGVADLFRPFAAGPPGAGSAPSSPVPSPTTSPRTGSGSTSDTYSRVSDELPRQATAQPSPDRNLCFTPPPKPSTPARAPDARPFVGAPLTKVMCLDRRALAPDLQQRLLAARNVLTAAVHLLGRLNAWGPNFARHHREIAWMSASTPLEQIAAAPLADFPDLPAAARAVRARLLARPLRTYDASVSLLRLALKAACAPAADSTDGMPSALFGAGAAVGAPYAPSRFVYRRIPLRPDSSLFKSVMSAIGVTVRCVPASRVPRPQAPALFRYAPAAPRRFEELRCPDEDDLQSNAVFVLAAPARRRLFVWSGRGVPRAGEAARAAAAYREDFADARAFDTAFEREDSESDSFWDAFDEA